MFAAYKYTILLLLLTLVGVVLHFYNLNWGAPYYFHPDERNIASSVSQLHFPDQMNPHFFAYGSLPIYIIYFTGMLCNVFLHQSGHANATVLFENAILISRFYSALFATLLIPLMFKIGTVLKNKDFGIIAAFFTTSCVGFIQFSHFGTFEFWLTFFSVLLYWYAIETSTGKSDLSLVKMSGVFGILLATKVSHLTALIFPFLALILQEIKHKTRISFRRSSVHVFHGWVICICITALIYILSNPYVFKTTSEFLGSMKYESSVALGTLPVFYTGEFYTAIPVIFQFLHVYPFLLNPVLTILFIPALLYFIYVSFKEKSIEKIMLLLFFLILFVSQAFLYVKWTRYMMPTIPFMLLILLVSIDKLIVTMKIKSASVAVFSVLTGISILFGLSYFITVFVRPDSRLVAERYAKLTIPANASIMSEVYDMGITPFNIDFPDISLFNFYELDNNNPEFSTDMLTGQMAAADYIILPSQRLLKVRLQNKKKFPNGYNFYSQLINGKTEFKKIYETPCDFFCKITYLDSPVFSYEETANVFDRPEVYIFKKYSYEAH